MNKSLGIIFGPNGSGKGTLATNLSTNLDYFHYDNGKHLRDWAEQKNREDILKLIDYGEFVSDEIVDQSIHDKFAEINHHQKVLLDGIPRKLSQVNLIQEFCFKYHYQPLWIIILHAPLDALIKRLKERVVAPDGKDYHMTMNPPPKHFKLSQLKPRPDDQPEIVRKRYEYYITNTLECLSDRFFLNTKVLTIDATEPIDDVFEKAKEFVIQSEIENQSEI